MLVKQRTMLINTLRGLTAEFRIVVADRPQHVGELVEILADPADKRIPTPLHQGLLVIVESLRGLERRIAIVDKQIVGWGRGNPTCPAPDHHPRLRTDPLQRDRSDGRQPRRLRQRATLRRLAWLGTAAGRHRRQQPALAKVGVKLGPIGKRGNGYLRRLLVNGAISVLGSKQTKQDPWLVRLLEPSRAWSRSARSPARWRASAGRC